MTNPHPKTYLPQIAASVVVLIGIFPCDYSYYGFLRTAVFFVCLYDGFLLVEKNPTLAYTLWGAAALFNPLLPVHLDKGLWKVLDVGVIALMITSAKVLWDKNPPTEG